MTCPVCPRHCAAVPGFCAEKIGTSGEPEAEARLRLAWAGLHFGEEPPVTGRGGSGAIFVCGCNLRCTFCQNHQISQGGLGRPVDKGEFLAICAALEKAGAENLNIVTGSHQTGILAEYLRAYKKGAPGAGRGGLPVAWNSSAYESVDTLEGLSDLVDLWLPDLKTLSSAAAATFFAAPDYPEAAKNAILWMIAQGKRPGKMCIIRHLHLPGFLEETVAVLDWLSRHARSAVVSLMTQYTPVKNAAGSAPESYTAPEDYETLKGLLKAYNFPRLFYQELVSDDSWLPDFSRPCPFPADMAKPVWTHRFSITSSKTHPAF